MRSLRQWRIQVQGTGRAGLQRSAVKTRRRTFSLERSFHEHQHLALFDDVGLPHQDLDDLAGFWRYDLNLHLHRLENEQRLVLADHIPWFGHDLPYVADQLGLDLNQFLLTPCKCMVGDVRPGQRPLYRGGRFSKNAMRPSAESSVSVTRATNECRYSRAPSKSMSCWR